MSSYTPMVVISDWGEVVGNAGCCAGEVGDVLLSVSDDEMVDFQAKVDQLASDIQSQSPVTAGNPDGTINPKFFAWKNFMGRWIAFHGEWTGWAVTHKTGASRIPDSAAVEFGGFKGRYNVLRNEFVSFGGDPTTGPVSTEPAADRPFIDVPWGKFLLLGGVAVAGYWLFAMGGWGRVTSR